MGYKLSSAENMSIVLHFYDRELKNAQIDYTIAGRIFVSLDTEYPKDLVAQLWAGRYWYGRRHYIKTH